MATRVSDGARLTRGQRVYLKKTTPSIVLDSLGLRRPRQMALRVQRDEPGNGQTFLETPRGVQGVDRSFLILA